MSANKKRKIFSLHFRLTLAFGIILVMVLLFFLLFSYHTCKYYLNKQTEKNLISFSSELTSLIARSESHDFQPDLMTLSRILKEEENVKYISFLDHNSEITFFKSKNQQNDTEKLKILLSQIDLSEITLSDFRKVGSDLVFILPLASLIPDHLSGYILLGLNEGMNSALAGKSLLTLILFSLLLLLAGLLALHQVSRRVTAPVKYLMNGTEQVINGNFDFQIQVYDEGDLGQLARKFNEMTSKLSYFNNQKALLNKKLNEVNEALEEKVRERTAQLKKIQQEVLSIFHQIPVGLLVIDKQSRIMWYNHELLKIVGLPEDTAISRKKISQIEHLNQIGLSEVLDKLKTKTGKQVLQHHLNFENGKPPVLVEIASREVIRDNAKVDGTIFIIKDVTREVRLEQRMFQDQRLENIGKIAGGIAHDFNNILAIILPNAQLLKMQLEDRPEWVKYLDTIEKAADQAASLTRKILSFSRGSSIENFEVLNLNEQITEFTKMFRRVLDRKIDLIENLDTKLWNIRAEKSQIEQILMNLSVNSRDAMPSGGKLIYQTCNVVIGRDEKSSLELKLDPGKYVCLTVSDSGSGIPQKHLDRIFDPFFSSKKEGQGTGLGLSVVYGIIKAHRGIIEVKSRENEGTHFHIFFPACWQKKEKITEVTEQLVTGSGTLLIVDDEAMIRETLKGMLETLNYKVIFADNGKEAIQIFKNYRHEIDAILMDIQMPVMDGVEAAEKILQLNPHATIVFTSGYAEQRNFDKLRRMGYQLFIKKPYKISNLADIILKALSKKAAYN